MALARLDPKVTEFRNQLSVNLPAFLNLLVLVQPPLVRPAATANFKVKRKAM